jgi:hypothetical protein
MSIPHRISRFHHIVTDCGTDLLKGNYKMFTTSIVKIGQVVKNSERQTKALI